MIAVGLVVMCVGMPLVSRKRGIDVGALVRETTRELGMLDKECHTSWGETNNSEWSRALDGYAALDLWKMSELPLKWWQAFLPKFGAALIKYHFRQLMGDLKAVKADIRRDFTKERVG